MSDNRTDVTPPPFKNFVFTGQLASENPTTTHSVITEIHSQNTAQVYRNNNPFKPSISPRSGVTNSPRSPTASHFDSEKAKSTIREVMEQQD